VLRSLLFNLAALVALVPAPLVFLRGRARRDTTFWATLLVATAGSLAWAGSLVADSWHTGFSVALWVSIATTLVVFVGLSAVSSHAWRLTPLLLPYLLLLGIVATVWTHGPERPLPIIQTMAWLDVHIAVSVLTYALVTLAAVAGLAVMLRERALRGKRSSAPLRGLPSVADCERLEFRLLAAGEIVLGIGLITGVATQYTEDGRLIDFGHKTVLALIVFAVIAILLIAHQRIGVRGRRAARYVLAAYILLTLAYPGVKFVTDVLLV